MSGCLILDKKSRKCTTTTTTSTGSNGLFRARSFVCYDKRIPNNNDDMISELPDDVLVSIIDRLPIKSAIRTSILSKRWRNLHRCVHNIDLDCPDLAGCCFMPDRSNSVTYSFDQFIRLRSGCKIRSFHLTCCITKSDSNRFEQCIYSLGSSGIEKLDLAFSFHRGLDDNIDDTICFPSHALSELSSLKYLKLTRCYLDPVLKSQCNSLKILSLCRVTLHPGAIECILSNCTRLQTLKMRFCISPSKLRFQGPRLKTVSIHVCEGVEDIELYASNLVVFEIENYKNVNIIFGNVPQLQSVRLHIHDQENVVPFVATKILTELPHLKSMDLFTSDLYFLQGNNRAIIPMETICLFSNLRRLDFSVRYTPEKTDLLLMTTPFLQICPLLQDFHLHVTLCPDHHRPRGKKRAIVFHSELKKVEISGFLGTENDIEFALYMLKSATGLEEMYISRCSKIYNGCGLWGGKHATPWSKAARRMIEKRLQRQAVSKTARVIIEHNARIENHGGIGEEDDYDICV